MRNDSPLSETDYTNQFVDFSQFNYYYSSQHYQSCESNLDSHSNDSSQENFPKKYEFNPLSEPFHPMKTYSTESEYDSINSIETPIPQMIEPIKKPSKDFVCILCPEKFNTLDELKTHIKNKVQLPFACVICGKSYKHDYSLYRHLKNHRGLKSFNCRGCHKKFRSLNQLRKHFEFCRYKLYIFA